MLGSLKNIGRFSTLRMQVGISNPLSSPGTEIMIKFCSSSRLTEGTLNMHIHLTANFFHV